jgi:hypothetical protein
MKSHQVLMAAFAILLAGCDKKPAKGTIASEQVAGTWFCPYFDQGGGPLRLELDLNGQWRWQPSVRPGDEAITSEGPSQQGTWVIQGDLLIMRISKSESCKIRVGDEFQFHILSVSTESAKAVDPFSYRDINGHETSAPETNSVTWTRKP